jgi:hypothetical protein
MAIHFILYQTSYFILSTPYFSQACWLVHNLNSIAVKMGIGARERNQHRSARKRSCAGELR